MGLKVWLPLISGFINQGISNTEIQSNQCTEDNNGKIGKCMSFNGSNSYIKLMTPPFNNDSTEFSYAAWVYPLNTNIGCLLSNRDASNSTGFCVFINNGGKITFDYGTRLSHTYTVPANTWTHIACVWKKGGARKIYINGTEVAGVETNTSVPTHATTTYAFIGASQNTPTSVNTNYFNGKLNDIRIYDHCLSAAEVREISQGLVLHYKLDDFSTLCGNRNYLLNSTGMLGADGWSGLVSSATDTNGAYYLIAKRTDTSSSSRTFCHRGITSYVSSWAPGTIFIISGWYMIPSSETYAVTGNMFIRWQYGSSYSDTGWSTDINAVKDTWIRFEKTFAVPASYDNSSGVTFYLSAFSKGLSTIYWKNIKLELGTIATNWCPADNEVTDQRTKITDCSGYGHNGTIVGNLNLINNTPRYSSATNFNGSSAIKYTSFNLGNIWSAGMWFYSSSSVTTGWGALFTVNTSGGDADLKMNLYLQQTSGKIQYSANGQYDSSPTFTKDVWHHLMETFDGTTLSCYLDGALIKTKAITNAEFTRSNLYVGARSSAANGSSASNYINAYISDFRIYCTALDAAAVKQLYELGAKVDNKGNIHTFELMETGNNLLYPTNLALWDNTFNNYLSSYTQANCQITLTNKGYRIYRPPNIKNANNGGANNMWGGLKIVNQNTDSIRLYDANVDNLLGLQQGHTYLFAFHIQGKSSTKNNYLKWSNNMGYEGRGMLPSPTVLSSSGIPDNFNGEKDCHYIFTINDSISKTCTTTYSSYTSGKIYLSYRHLMFSWDYVDTGTLGTDLYLTDFRLYDITNHMAKFTKTGQATFFSFVEQMNKCAIRKNSELLASEFIEL